MSTVLIVAVIIALFLVAYFSGIEVAYGLSNRLNIELKKKQGNSSGILLARLMDEPSRFMGSTIVGLHLFLVIFVLLVSTWWNVLINMSHIVIPDAYLIPIRMVMEVLLSASAVILLGEFIPRAIFRAKPDSLLTFAARIGWLSFTDRFFAPVAGAFVKIAQWILKVIFDVRIDSRREAFSRSDIEHFIQQNTEFYEENKDMNAELFEAALSLPKIRIRESLVPRKEIEAIDLHASVEDLRKKLVSTQLSRLVVYDGNVDHIVGYIHQLDLFRHPASIQEILHPIPAVPESMSVTDLIGKFSRERKSIAWVVDEFGGTAGIVTMEDLLEEIFGEIKDEYDVEEFEEKKVADDEFILSGRLELDYLSEKYGLSFPENNSETLSGYIIDHHETIPRLKERIIIGDYEFDVMNVSDTRIEMVRLKILK